MHRTRHAQDIASRFRTMMEEAGDSLSDEHFDELVLLVEAGIDTALVERLEKMADAISDLADKVRSDAEFFD